jgi:hypothetical protein
LIFALLIFATPGFWLHNNVITGHTGIARLVGLRLGVVVELLLVLLFLVSLLPLVGVFHIFVEPFT